MKDRDEDIDTAVTVTVTVTATKIPSTAPIDTTTGIALRMIDMAAERRMKMMMEDAGINDLGIQRATARRESIGTNDAIETEMETETEAEALTEIIRKKSHKNLL